MIDSHCHLDYEPLLSNLDKVIQRSKDIGIKKILTICTSLNSFMKIKDIVNRHYPQVKFDYVDPRPGDVARTKADIRKLKNIGWSADIAIEDGIDSCFKELKNELS